MARSALDEWLDLVPANKIIGFGGDAFLWVEWIVGDLVQSRENIAAVLAKRVRAGTLSEESSLELAKTRCSSIIRGPSSAWMLTRATSHATSRGTSTD